MEEFWKPTFPRLSDCSWPGTIRYFAQTSGTTTGITKYIPCSRDMIRANSWAIFDLLTHHFAHRPKSRLFGGRNFMLGGSTQLTELAPGIRGGDLSGIAARTAPMWVRPFYFPPRDLGSIADWDEKIAALAPASLNANIRGFGGTPSWVLLFLDKLAALRPEAGRRLVGLYPDLELFVHGGVNFAPYQSILAEWLKGSHAETREVYPASEGFIAAADRREGEGLRMIVDNGLFYEFVPVEELEAANLTRHWLANAETGIDYALVLSTCAGLWSYIIGDTIRFVRSRPAADCGDRPHIGPACRRSASICIEQGNRKAITTAATAIGSGVADFSVGALFPQGEGELGGHLYIAEFSDGAPTRTGSPNLRACWMRRCVR